MSIELSYIPKWCEIILMLSLLKNCISVHHKSVNSKGKLRDGTMLFFYILLQWDIIRIIIFHFFVTLYFILFNFLVLCHLLIKRLGYRDKEVLFSFIIDNTFWLSGWFHIDVVNAFQKSSYCVEQLIFYYLNMQIIDLSGCIYVFCKCFLCFKMTW